MPKVSTNTLRGCVVLLFVVLDMSRLELGAWSLELQKLRVPASIKSYVSFSQGQGDARDTL